MQHKLQNNLLQSLSSPINCSKQKHGLKSVLIIRDVHLIEEVGPRAYYLLEDHRYVGPSLYLTMA